MKCRYISKCEHKTGWCNSEAVTFKCEFAAPMLKKELDDAKKFSVKYGKWVRNRPDIQKMKEFHDLGLGLAMSEKSIFWTCSECSKWGNPIYNYCPNCGAKMEGDTK